MEELVWHTVKRKVSELIPYQKNPRKISKQEQERLLESIKKFNLADIPGIDIDETLVWGHQRMKVLILLGRGEEEIDVRIPNRKLTEEEFKELNIRSNINNGDWDADILAENFDTQLLEDCGLEDVEKLLATAAINTETEEKEIPARPSEPECIIQKGDVFSINGHRIICGDSTSPEDMGRLMAGYKADMIFTDPPYNVKIDSIVNLGKTQHREFVQASGEMTEEEFTAFLTNAFNRMIECSKDGSIHYICMDWKHLYEIISAHRATTYEWKNLCVWVKDNGGMGTFYRSKHELVLVFKNGTAQHINNFELGQTGRYRTNVWEYAGANSFTSRGKSSLGNTVDVGDLKYHPTVKPLDMVADAIIDCSFRGNNILDSFLGSGTTLIACEKTGRFCFGSELDPAYVQVSITRYLNFLQQLRRPINFIHHQGRLQLEDFLPND